MRSVFEFATYKAFLAHKLASEGQRGQLSRAAEAIQTQRSYLSRVLSEELHLTPDHAFKLAKFWRLTPPEREYFLILVDIDRAADPEFRAHLKERANALKDKHDSVQNRAERAQFSGEALQVGYFSSWVWSAIHFLTSIPAYQNEDALADRLGLKRERVLVHLEHLQELKYVEKKSGRWIYKSGEFHAPKNSPLVILHHQNWRNRAMMDAQELDGANVHYTTVQTLSRDDYERIKALLLEFIAESSRIAAPSKPEEGIALTCDFFKI